MSFNISIEIRKVIPGDLPNVYRMICALEDDMLDQKDFSRVFEENLNNTSCFYFLAAAEEKTVGFISLHIQQLLHHCGPVGEIQEFYVDQNYRGKGLGRLLMNEVKKCAENNRVTSLEVTSNKKRVSTVPVYEGLGFKLTHNKFTL